MSVSLCDVTSPCLINDMLDCLFAGMSSNVYTLMWYKKKGGSVIKSLSSEVFSGLILLSSATPLVYSKRDHCLHQPDPNNSKLVGARPVKPKDVSA